MKTIIPMPGGAIREIEEERTQHSKTFEMPNGRKKLVASLRRAHIPDDIDKWRSGDSVGWVDIDTDFELKGNQYTVKNTWYTCTIETDRVAYSYISKDKGLVEIELRKIGNQAVENLTLTLKPVAKENVLTFPGLVPDLDLEFVARAEGLFVNKIIHSASAPRDFTWGIEQDADCPLHVNMKTRGHDNHGVKSPNRTSGRKGDTCRKIEMVHDVRDMPAQKHASACEFGETWTGRAYKRDDERRLVIDDEVEYPVWIDQDIVQPITADADDGYSVTNGNFYTSLTQFFGAYGGYLYYPFARFLALNIPPGSTIVLADLIVNVPTISASGNTGMIRGYDVDNAAQFAVGGPRPESSPQTTAGISANLTTTGLKTFNITSILQEIIDRPGWAALNDFALSFLEFTPGGINGGYIEDYSDALGNEPTLEITFDPPPTDSAVLVDYGAKTRRVQWAGIGPDGNGDPVIVGEQADITVQVTGTFAGALVEIQGSNDGVMYHALKQANGSPAVLAAPGLISILTRTWKIKPCVVGGGATDVDVVATLGR